MGNLEKNNKKDSYTLETNACVIINRFYDIITTLISDYNDLGIDTFNKFNAFIDTLEKKNARKLFTFHYAEYKEFYRKYKFIVDYIEDMKRYDCFFFFRELFEREENYLKYIDYLAEHRSEKANISEVVDKIRSLGIATIEFMPNNTFGETYRVNESITSGEFVFLDNIEAIPTCDYYQSEIMYRGNKSNYFMYLGRYTIDPERVSNSWSVIKVNNLLFDPNLLPNKIDYDETYNKIITSKKAKQFDYDLLESAVPVSVGIKDIEQSLEALRKAMMKVTNTTGKEKYLSEIDNIEESINQLKQYNSEYIESETKKSEDVTPEYIDEQVKRYIRKREESTYDLD